jgi:hypothetical protein
MTCHAGLRFVHHDLDFSKPAPLGFAQCRRCEGAYTMEQYLAWSCEGARPGPLPTERRVPPGGLRCALCGQAVHVDPVHRAVVEWFGTVCDSCFNLEDARV